ncbi:hypothetical protein CEXT_221451 [Caerostris extrusa]|uniref:Uncharacterized protein n=1 Tax=Caerostris extrusa TaxID=172846 RepID=A0AAV4W1H4_CAEEX|nr:hypothetical protein CEXT_221451 [Caerostris extrusa]
MRFFCCRKDRNPFPTPLKQKLSLPFLMPSYLVRVGGGIILYVRYGVRQDDLSCVKELVSNCSIQFLEKFQLEWSDISADRVRLRQPGHSESPVPVTLYFIRIVAENALGHSAPSEVVNVTTAEEGKSLPHLH